MFSPLLEILRYHRLTKTTLGANTVFLNFLTVISYNLLSNVAGLVHCHYLVSLLISIINPYNLTKDTILLQPQFQSNFPLLEIFSWILINLLLCKQTDHKMQSSLIGFMILRNVERCDLCLTYLL